MKTRETRKRDQWLLPLLLLALLVWGTACSDDKEERELIKYKVVELNMEDHRFEDLGTMSFLKDIECQKNSGSIFRLIIRNDSVFISYFGSLLYPTRLPSDFTVFGTPFVFSGEVKEQIKNTDYYPLILDEFKYELLMQM